MNLALIRRLPPWLIVVLMTAVAGCAAVDGYGVSDEYYESEGPIGYGGFGEPFGGFFEPFLGPYGYDYGGWQPGYRVGPPPRGGYDRRGWQSHGPRPAYRAAAPSRSIPSIPMRSRGGQWGHRGGERR